jgi:hypothetical protein
VFDCNVNIPKAFTRDKSDGRRRSFRPKSTLIPGLDIGGIASVAGDPVGTGSERLKPDRSLIGYTKTN